MTRRARAAVAVGVAAIVCSGCVPGGTSDAGPPSEVGEVTNVVDGDTVDVATAAGTKRVRILGIDTPETVKPGAPVQCWGPEATEFAIAALSGQRVRLLPEAGQDDVDDYGRVLRYVLTQPTGENYSIAAAEVGAARAYVYDDTRPPELAGEIAAAQDRAEAAGRGLWGPPCHGGL